jgi:O-acetylhomoserine/O-acetylserine sulfhydrylase-like pyridoxal-dependent enzyme
MFAYGSVLSFELAALAGEGALARGRRFLESLRVATHAVSLGDARTLVVHPASTTHSTMPEHARREAGISDGLIRVSCGLESCPEILRDIDGALGPT